MSDKPKTAVEQVFNAFQEFTTSIFNTVAEPRTLVLVVDWQIGQRDFPAGILVSREKQLSPLTLLEIGAQLGKMKERILTAYGSSLEDMMKLFTSLATQIEQMQQELKKAEANNPPATASEHI